MADKPPSIAVGRIAESGQREPLDAIARSGGSALGSRTAEPRRRPKGGRPQDRCSQMLSKIRRRAPSIGHAVECGQDTDIVSNVESGLPFPGVALPK